jgi:hypothetical protein
VFFKDLGRLNFMYEFIFGTFFGWGITQLLNRKKPTPKTDASVQAWEDPWIPTTTEAIKIPNSRPQFIPGMLKNFWGSDS